MAVKQTLAALLRDELKVALKGTFKEFYIGDPLQIPQQSLPCVVIEIQREEAAQGPTGMDILRTTVLIKLIVNKKEDFGKRANEVLWRSRLEAMVGARDKTSNQYLDESVLGLLRKKFTMNGRLVENSEIVEYGLTPRPQDVITEEAHVTATFEEFVEVPSRT